MKVLVTGASGFLGSHICEACNDAGYDVHALIRKSSLTRWIDKPWIRIHRSDLFDRRTLSNIMKKTDAVIHNAGTLWGDYQKINTEGSRVIAEESVKAGIKRFVYVSSLAAGGPGDNSQPRDESMPDRPVSPYGHSKKDAELILESMKNKMKIVILRYPMLFGPRDEQTIRLFESFKYCINPSVGVRRRYISVVYVKDAANAAVKALQAQVPSGSIYNISDNRAYTFIRLYKIIGEVWGRIALRIPVPFDLMMFVSWAINDVLKGKTAFNPEQLGMFRERFWLISSEKANKELGWQAQWSINDAIAETIAWYKDKHWL